MKTSHRSKIKHSNTMGWILQLLALALVLLSFISCCECEQLSTVFILETSDSDSTSGSGMDAAPSAIQGNKPSSVTDHTQIITDDASNQSPSANKPTVGPKISINSPPKQVSKLQQSQAAQSESVDSKRNLDEDNSGYSSDAPSVSDTDIQPEIRYIESAPISNVRPAEETSPRPNTRLKVGSSPASRATSNQQQQQLANNVNQQRTRSTSTRPVEDDQDRSVTTPKSEERLLISIVQDDDYYKPPKSNQGPNNGGSGYSSDEVPPPLPKRKPAITISIQEGNFNKQNGGSSSALVVNGQSIVISTLGGSSIDSHSQSNSFIGDKPTISVVPSHNTHNNNHNGNHNNNNHHQVIQNTAQNTRPPLREPVEGPVNSGIELNPPYLSSSTTYRPQQNNDFVNNPSSSNQRPIISTPIDHPKPQIQISDERPQRPVSVPISDLISDDQKRPTSRPINRPPATSEPIIANDPIPEETSSSKYPLNERNCGLVHETKIVGGEEADPDDFLWMAAIVKSKPSTGDVRPFCGGSLITRRHILTAAHCLENLAPRDVLVRLGSYDFDDSTASSLSADYAIDQFRVPSQYSKKTHVADIAIMRLKTPISLSDNYKTVCMSQPRRSYVGALGTVTGYGSQSQTFRRAAPKLRQVTVPIWENRKCSIVYKKNLTDSFLCAGYEEGGKDACQGDSGGPLMTEGPNERMMVVGVVSHGIGCGAPGYPGVYTRTSTFLEWIEKNTRE